MSVTEVKVIVQGRWPLLEYFRIKLSDSCGTEVFDALADANWPKLKHLAVYAQDALEYRSQSMRYGTDEDVDVEEQRYFMTAFAEKKPFPELQQLSFEGIYVKKEDFEAIKEAGWKDLRTFEFGYVEKNAPGINSP